MSGWRPTVSRLAGITLATIRNPRLPFSWRSGTLWVIVAVNVVLLGLYFWSRGGETTHVRIEAEGTRYTVWVDGAQIIDSALAGRPSGGIGFDLPAEDPVHSLPDPSGIDHLLVTDLDTGEVLLEEAFDDVPEEPWQQLSGEWNTEDGVLRATSSGAFAVPGEDWTDYAVDATLKNVSSIQFSVRVEDRENRVLVGMRPFQHHDTSIRLFTDGAEESVELGQPVELARSEATKSLFAMLLRPYPVILAMIIIAALIAFVVRVPRLESALQELGTIVTSSANAIVIVLALAAFVLLWYINYIVGEGVPHVPDSVVYVFQSKLFASFQVTADEPPVTRSFAFFNPPFMHVVDGRWFGQYPFGHPLFLSIGSLFNAVWLVPPALGAASVYLIHRVGVHVYGAAAGLLAAILLFFSPFFQMTASNFMSHNTAVFVILFTLFLIARPTKRRTLSMFVAGVSLGLLFNIRPLVAVAFIPPLAVLLSYDLLRAGAVGRLLSRVRGRGTKDERDTFDNDKRIIMANLAFAAGAVLLLVAYFLYNNATTGEFTTSPQMLTFGDTSEWVGFSGRHSVALGIQNEKTLLSIMLLVANGWPVFIGLFLAALPFVLGSRTKWDYFFAASALSLATVILYYRNSAVMHGPRFWYETMPFVMLLSARGILYLKDAASSVGDWLAIRTGWSPSGTTASSTTAVAVFALVAGLIAFSAYGWMLGRRDAWEGIDFVPATISDLDGFNFTDARLLDRADELDVKNALVLVEPCSGWWCYGSVLWTNSPDLKNNVVWAERRRDQNDIDLLAFYEGRNLYVADYDSGTVLPATAEEILDEAVPEAATPAPEPPPADEPDSTAEERDQIRVFQLEALRQALEDYREQEGSYPESDGQVQSLCVYREIDAGCALTEFLPMLPEDPLGDPTTNGYWYRSDGETYLLIAIRETLDENAGPCPDDLPDDREAFEQAYCLEGPSP